MWNTIRRLPSPSMVVAFLALLAAIGGTAVALPGKNKVDRNDIRKNAVTGKTIKSNAVTGAKVKNDSLRGTDILEPSLGTVPSANRANTANSADRANTANTADTATNASNAGEANTLDGLDSTQFPRAYALVTPTPPFLEATRSTGFASVRRPATGIYCLLPAAGSGLDWDTRPAIVSAEWNNSAGFDLNAHAAATSRFGGCVAPEYQVVTTSADAFANNTAFTIIVP